MPGRSVSASAVTEVRLEGADRFISAMEKIQKSVDKVSKSLDTGFKRSGAATRREVDNLSKSFFKFRDSVNLFSTSWNRLSNSVFVFFRRLARIRTAFFILVTFLGLRQVVAFLESLKDFSYEAEQAVNRLTQRISHLKKVIGDALAPFIEEFGGKFVTGFLEGFQKIVNSSAFKNFVSAFFYASNIVGKFGKVLVTVFTFVVDGFRLAAKEIKVFFLIIKDAYADLFASIFFKLSNFLRDVADKLVPEVATAFQGLASDLAVAARDLEFGGEKRFKDIRQLTDEIQVLGETWAENARNFKASFEDFVGSTVSNATVESAAKFVAAMRKVTDSVVSADKSFKSGGRSLALFVDGLRSGLAKFSLETSRDIGKSLGEGLADAFDNAFGESFLAIMQGRFKDLRDVVTSFLQDLQREFAKFASRRVSKVLLDTIVDKVAPAIAGLFDPTAGGPSASTIASNDPNSISYRGSPDFIGPPVSTGSGHAYGGVSYSPTIRAFAEKGPEASIPLRGGKVPVQLMGGRGGGNTIVIAPQVIDGPSFGVWLEKEKKTLYRIMAGGISGGSSIVRSSLRTHFGRD